MSNTFQANIGAKMKYRITITVDENVLLGIKEKIRNREFKNKSNAFEQAAKLLLKSQEA